MHSSPSRRVWATALWLLAVIAATIGTYTIALARLPQQRAAIESLIRAQTGYDLRFDRVAVRLGFYGPEAQFTDVQMWRPGSERRLLRASELVVRFETWRLLRTGSLQPGRILLTGAQIDAGALRAAPRVASSAAQDRQMPENVLLQWLVGFARALPIGRIELESATLRGLERDESEEVTGRVVRIPRLSIQRTADGARVSGNALLAERLGRSLFVSLELRGIDGALEALEGGLTVQGRALRLAGWRALLGGPQSGASGVGDLRATLRLRGGRISAGSVALAASDLRVPAVNGAEPARFSRLSADASLERVVDGWRVLGTDLRVVLPGSPIASLDYQIEADAAWRQVRLSIDGVPFGWLRPLLSLPQPLDLEGTVSTLRVTAVSQPGGLALRYSGRVESAVWRDPGGRMRLAPLAFAVDGDETAATITFADRPLKLNVGAESDDEQLLDVAVRGVAILTREPGGWRLESDALTVLDRAASLPRERLELRGALRGAAPNAAALSLEVLLLAPLASDELPQLRALSQRVLDGAPIESFSLVTGRLVIRAGSTPTQGWRVESSAGDLMVGAATFRPDADWPALSEAAGRLVWDESDLRFDFDRGAIGDLRLVRGQLRGGAERSWSVVATGPTRTALRALAASPLATRVPLELRSAAVDGDARFELRVARRGGAQDAGGGKDAPLRWSLVVSFGALRWQALPGVAPIEGLAGALRIVDGRLQPTRIEGRWLDQPLRVVVGERRGGRRWQMSGRLPEGPLRQLLADAYALDAAMAPRWRLEAEPVRSDASRWRVDLAIDSLPVRGQFELAALPEGLELRRGALRVGTGAVRLPEADTIELKAAVPALELTRLVPAWSALPRRAAAAPPLTGSVDIESIGLLGESLGAASMQLTNSRGAPALMLRGARLDGSLFDTDAGSDGSAIPRLELARLELDRLPGRAALTAAAGAPPWALDLQVGDLRLGARRLGAVRGRLEFSSESLEFESAVLEAGEVGARGRLECRRNAQRCTLDGRIVGGAARSALELWGVAPGLDAARLDGTLRLAWPIAPADSVWTALEGELRLVAREGALDAPVRLGLVPEPAASAWPWEELALEARIGAGQIEVTRLAFEGTQRLLLAGSVQLPSAQVSLEGTWWPRRELPRALQDLPAAPALAAIWRTMRGQPVTPRAVRVAGPLAALGMEVVPLQSPPPP